MRMVGFSAWLLLLGGVVVLGSLGACGGGDTNSGSQSEPPQLSSGLGGGGTGGSNAGGAGGGDSAKKACTAYAKAECTRIGKCSDGYQITVRFGDEDTCESRTEQACEAALLSPDNGETSADVEACTAAVPNEGCVDLFDNLPPAACAPEDGRAHRKPRMRHAVAVQERLVRARSLLDVRRLHRGPARGEPVC